MDKAVEKMWKQMENAVEKPGETGIHSVFIYFLWKDLGKERENGRNYLIMGRKKNLRIYPLGGLLTGNLK